MVRRERVGEVGVDHGGVAIVDPEFVGISDLDQEKIMDARVGTDLDCETAETVGVFVATGLGDGVYPVYADVVDVPGAGRRVARIVIDCLGVEEESGELRELLGESVAALREQGGWRVRLPFEVGAPDDDVRRRALGEDVAR